MVWIPSANEQGGHPRPKRMTDIPNNGAMVLIDRSSYLTEKSRSLSGWTGNM